ncbi:hypothetical protein GCM10010468_74490 [Actinocorallia longicatena]|uniref:Acyltransferase 3 domain-containing protein n=2 Tax=Actinocorallia longicatena TaxID=111803 RepID=A0ABP6QN45_9ACTN
MPLFIIVTGYFSRSFGVAKDRSVKLVTSLVVPYLIFQTAYICFERYVGGAHVRFSLYDPYGLMWFILALVVWRASTPFWQRVRRPLAIAVVVSVTSGLFPLPGEFDLHNTIGMIPFYVLGLCLRPSHFEVLRERGVRIGSAALLAAVAVACWLWVREVSIKPLFWGDPYKEMRFTALEGMTVKLGLLAACTVISFAVLAVVPRRHTWFTRLGANTLYVYLLHGFVVYFARYQGLFEEDWTHTMPGALVLAAGAAALAVALSLPPVVRVFRPVMEPELGWAFRR